MIRWRETRIVEAEAPKAWRRYPTGTRIALTPCGQYALLDTGVGVSARTLRGAYSASHGLRETLDAVADSLFEAEAPVWAPGSDWTRIEGGAE